LDENDDRPTEELSLTLKLLLFLLLLAEGRNRSGEDPVQKKDTEEEEDDDDPIAATCTARLVVVLIPVEREEVSAAHWRSIQRAIFMVKKVVRFDLCFHVCFYYYYDN